MPVITINGPVGSGAIEVGQMVAQKMGLNYVDRLVLAEAAKLVRSPVGALVNKEQQLDRFRDRLARFLDNMLERSAAMSDHDFGFGIDTLSEEYFQLGSEPSSALQRVNDKAFIEATTSVVKDLHRGGNVVIIGRGAHIILADAPGTFHVGVLAPVEIRVETIMMREHLTRPEAQAHTRDLELARVRFFKKFFKVDPNDPSQYHLMLNLGMVRPEQAATTIVQAVTRTTPESLLRAARS